MSLVINTNVASLNSQRQLMNSGGALDRATERLSSGQRINSAKDDAAGLAISNRMTSQVRGIDQAIRNANDGVSLIQTAEGALQETTNILQRMRELAIQSGNGIYTNADRKTLDAEVQQLIAELNRIALSTSFNGQKLLDGTLGNVKLQVGADAGQTITMKIPKMDAKTLGMGSQSGDVAGTHFSQNLSTTLFKDGDILINGKSIGAFDGTKTPPDTLAMLLANINEKVTGVTATAFNQVTTTTVGTGVTTAAAPIVITLTNPDLTTSAFTIDNTNNLDGLIAAINSQSGGLLVAAKTDSGFISLSNANGASINVTGAGAAAALGTIPTNTYPQIALTAKDGSDILITQGPEAQQPTKITAAAFGTTLLGATLSINGVSMTAFGAGDAIGAVITNINTYTNKTGVTAVNSGGVIVLSDAKGRDITISGSAAGTAATVGLTNGTYKAPSLLQVLGFQETRNDGTVFGQHITAAESVTSLAYGDLKINGVIIDGQNTATLQGKVDNINKVSDDTGVIASLKAENVSSFNELKTTTEVTGGTPGAAHAANDSIMINGVNVVLTGTSMTADIANINAAVATTGVEAYQDSTGKIHLFSEGQINIAAGTTNGAAVLTALNLTASNNAPTAALQNPVVAGSIRLNNTSIAITNIGDLSTVVSSINAQQANTGVFAGLNELGELVLNSNSAFAISLGDTNGAKTLSAMGLDTSLAGPVGGLRPTNVLASINLNSLRNNPIGIEVTANGSTVTGLKSQNVTMSGAGFGDSITNVSIATQVGAQKALSVIDKALDTISDVRSQMGAINNRLEFTVNNLANVSEKTSSARSRIVDADFALETAALSRASVLQQAAEAMLAQANSRPQQVLSLLRQ